MALSRITYSADGSTQIFGVPFSFIKRADVHVYVQGTETTDFTWQSDSQLTITTPTVVASDEIIIIRRTNSVSFDSDFIDGSGLPASDLDTATLQLFYLMQESLDDLGPPVDAGISATAAAASADAAAASAAAAAASAATIDLTAPGPIGGTTPGTGAFTTLTSTGGALNGTLGATTPGTIDGTVVTASSSLDIGSTIAITGVLDEDTMSSDSAVKLATQQSIKAYVDNQRVQISYVSADYDVSTASGTQSITGAGFTPTSVEATAFLSGGGKGSFGNYDGTSYYCNSTSPAAGQLVPNASYLISYIDGSGNNAQATIAFTSDGGTLTWAKTLSPTGTLKMRFKFTRVG